MKHFLTSLAMSAVAGAIAAGIMLILLRSSNVCAQDGMIQCNPVTYVTPAGRWVTCMSCYYPASGQVVVSNCM